MRKGEHSSRIELAYCDDDEEEGDIGFLQYDNVLLPHWRELATALQLCQSNDIDLTIQNVQLTTSVTDVLIPALKGKLHELYLENNEFVDIYKGAEFIITCIESNPLMKEFCLVNNQLETTDNIGAVLDTVISHPSIDHIRLENCLGGDINSYDILCSVLASGKQFDTVDFDTNNISTGGETGISETTL